jgi:peptidylprolyl isomerase
VSKREKGLLVIVILILLAIGIVACRAAGDSEDEVATATASGEAGSDDNGSTSAQSSDSELAQAVPTGQASAPGDSSGTAFDLYAGLGEDAFTTTDSGLRYAIVEQGDGDQQPSAGQVVSVQYTGMLEDGSVFDTSTDTGEPIRFPLGQGFVISGWDEGIALLEKGDKARFIIPSELGYGETGGGPIPPNATLIFDVELVDITEGPPEAPVAVPEGAYVVTESGLKYYDIVVGDGQSAELGMIVFLNYTAWLQDGTLIDSTMRTGQPIQTILDGSQLPVGWEEGLVGMQVGGSRQLVIPPQLAMRDVDLLAGGSPPPDNIIIEMELLDVFGPEQ